MTEAGWTSGTVQVRKAIERFRRKTVKGEGENACWLFAGFIDKHGYGLCRPGFGKLNVRAHRYAWILEHGPIPEGMLVLHKCDVRACVNPEHLFLGSNRDNVDDMLKKGRQRKGENHPARIDPSRWARGERHGQAKMTVEKVAELRRLLANGLTNTGAAKMFGDCNLLYTRKGKRLNLIPCLVGAVFMWTVMAGDAMAYGLSPIAAAAPKPVSVTADQPSKFDQNDRVERFIPPLWFVLFVCSLFVIAIIIATVAAWKNHKRNKRLFGP